MNQFQKNRVPACAAMLILLCAGLISCNSPEKAAMIISKKAKQQAAKLNFSKEICLENPIEQLENVIYTPTFSAFFVEKNELIATW